MLKSNNKIYSLEEVTKKLENYCNYQERCHFEVEKKLRQMGLVKKTQEIIILHLLEHDYLNEERFAKAFSRGKFNIKKWGKIRITNELRQKNVSKYNINIALKEIDSNEYLNAFDALAQKRLLQINEINKNKQRKKFADYLLYRGWESERVYKKMWELIP